MSSDVITPTVETLQQEIIELRQELGRYRRLASFPQSNPQPVLEFDLSGNLIYSNPASIQTLADCGLEDARSFLPTNYAELSQALRDSDTHKQRIELDINHHNFEEAMYYEPEFKTIRIFASDISPRRQVEKALRRSQNELSQTQDFIETVTKGTEALIATIDHSYRLTYFSQAYKAEVERLSGRTIHTGMSILDALSDIPEDQKSVQQVWDRVLNGESLTQQRELGDPRESRRSYNVLYTPIRDANGNIVGAGEIASDITEQLKTQKALQDSETRFRMLLKNAPVTIAAQDTDLKFIWAYNQRTVDPAEVIGKTDADIFPPEVAAWTIGLKHQVLESGKDLHEQGWITSGGQRLFLDIFLEPIRNEAGDITGVGVATVDLTGYKLAEMALRESEERYRSLFASMNEGFAIHKIIYDEQGNPCDYRFLDINPAFERLTGLKRDAVVGKTYHEILPEEGDSWIKNYGKVVTTGEPAQFEEFSPSLGKYYEVFAYRCAQDQFAVIFLDISERMQMEDNLRINLTKYSVLFDTLPLGVTITDKNGQIVESNQEAIRLLGLSEEEQKRRRIEGEEWKIVRTDGTVMPAEEFASVRAMQEQRRISDVEMGILKDKDQTTWISVTAAPLPLKDYGIVITYIDITRRIQAEEELHHAHEQLELTVQQRTKQLLDANVELKAEIEERKRVEAQLLIQTRAVEAERKRFNDVLELLPVYTILLTADYHVAFANRYFRERFGEDHGRRCYEYLFGLDAACDNCETYKVLKTGAPQRWEWTGPDSRNYDVFDFPFHDIDGSTIILELGIDITDRKQAEEKLRSMNAYNRSLLEASLDALVTITADGKIGDVNSVTEAITGYSRDELIGTDFHSYFTEPEKARSGYQRVFETGTLRDYELEIHHRDGHTTPVLYNASLYIDETSNATGVFAAARDITDRKQAERQLILLTKALEAAANGTVVVDKDGTILWTNPALSQMTGYSADELRGQNPRLLKSGKQNQEFYDDLWNTILAGKVWRGDLTNRKKDGTLYDESQTITPVFDRSGNITNFISIKQDVTVHKKAEKALIKSEEQYRSLVKATSQIVWQTNAEGAVVEDNPVWRNFTGQSLEEFMGSGWINAIHPADQKRVLDIWTEAVEKQTSYDVECRIRKFNGEFSDFSIRGVPIRDAAGNILSWVGTCTDITDKKNYENQLLQAEKHAVVGRMVGSVTHEINNPLQTIKNCLFLIRQDIPTDSPDNEPLEMAISETRRLANLVGQLRQLYRPQSSQTMEPHDILGILDEVHSLITPHLNNSHVSWQGMPGLENCQVSCVREQMVEVFLNISMNAIEAMQPEGGLLSVDMSFSQEKDMMGISLSDNGPGINADILPHLFEPFITTKGYGLGLGLSICFGIIQKHKGQITVDSLPGEGTKFTIWLPIANVTKE